jgi:hypothetical protein
MNERIRELARESGLLVHNPEGVPTKLEKFAELIIKESIKVMMENDYHGEWLGEELKEHFGIKT